jgi:hypothetical protein
LLSEPNIEISYKAICERYLNNPLSHSLVLGGLEPFDSFSDVVGLVETLRHEYKCDDDIVIYTGYTEYEVQEKIDQLKEKDLLPLLIKFGRFRPGQESHLDESLGVELANSEQYGKWVTA